MLWRQRTAFLLLAGVIEVLACGGGDGGGGPPDHRTLGALTEAELGPLCEQLAAIAGGYDARKPVTCEGVTRDLVYIIGADKVECMFRLRSTPAGCAGLTVGQVKQCERDFYNQTCETIGQTPPSCVDVFGCDT